MFSPEQKEQVQESFLTMAGLTEIDPAQEEDFDELVDRWLREEDACVFYIGCPDFEDRPALMRAIHAARAICGMQRMGAIRLLREAADDLEQRGPGVCDIIDPF